MLEALKKTANKTCTENGAVTNRSTGKDCLDLFAVIGALRRESDQEIAARFMRAYTENPDIAMKILFFSRDIRGGLGERRVFRTILKWMAEQEKHSLVRNLPHIAEYGRWDDILVLLDTPCRAEALELLKEQFRADLAALENGSEVSLLGKWLPSVNPARKAYGRQSRLQKHSGSPSMTTAKRLYCCVRISVSWKTTCVRRIIPLIMRSSRPRLCSSIAGHFSAMTASAMKNF